MSGIFDWVMSTFIAPYYQGWIRHAAAGWAVWLMAHGVLSNTPDAEKQFTGAILFLAAIVWSMVDKYGKKLILDQLATVMASLPSTNPQASSTPPA